MVYAVVARAVFVVPLTPFTTTFVLSFKPSGNSSFKVNVVIFSIAEGTVAFTLNDIVSVAEALADATAAGDDASDIKAPNGTDTQSASGLPVAVCVAAGLDITDPTAAVTAVPVDNDTNASNVTLQMDATGLTPEPGVVINFAVKQGETPVPGSPFPANAILVPCATGIYTVEPVSVTAVPAP